MWSSARHLATTCIAAAVVTTALAQDAPVPPPAPEKPQEPPKPEEPAKPADPAKPSSPPRVPFSGTADDLAAKFPQVVRVVDYGRSAGGKPLRLVTVSAAKDAEIEWEALVVAHLSGLRPETDSALALDVAARLAERAADLPPRVAFRVIADASPDTNLPFGVALRAGNATPTDEDQDGDADEDPPDDLDGDGAISWMRIPDPAGEWAADDASKPGAAPERADPAKGKPGAWRVVPEGRDDDADGLFNEDAPGGVDVSRNFTVGFEEHVPAAGCWAASEPETRALMDFVLADQRIAVVYELGSADTVAGNGEWGAGWPKLPDDDVKLLDGLRAAHAEGAVSLRVASEDAKNQKHKSKAPGAGSLAATTWHQLGRLWLGRAPLGETKPPWPLPGCAAPEGALTWKKLDGHGLPPGTEVARLEPVVTSRSGPQWYAETDSIADFLVLCAKGRAQVAFTKTETSGDPGVVRVETRLVNSGRLPTHTQRGADVTGRRPLNLRVKVPEGATLLAGKPLTQIERIAGGAETGPMRWVVRGPSGATVTVECTGPDTGTTTLEVRIP